MKFKTTFILCILTAGLLLPLVLSERNAFAQEQDGGQSAAQEEEKGNRSEAEQRREEQAATKEEDDEKGAQRNTSGGFVPSEDISEDLSVSFPVDI